MAAMRLAQLVKSILYGLKATDPASFVVAGCLLLNVALITENFANAAHYMAK